MKITKQAISILLSLVMLLTAIPLTGFDGIFAPKANATEPTQDIALMSSNATKQAVNNPKPEVTASDAEEVKNTISSMSVGDTFTFGSYPQSDVTEELGATLTAAAHSTDTWISYNYYVYGEQSDYMKYYDLTYNGERYRGVYLTKYRPNYCMDYLFQDDNGYYPNNIYWFKYEPLTWRVLDPATGYVICETIIDSQPFNNIDCVKYDELVHYNDETCQHLSNDWEYSAIRTWLNETFYVTAFSENERSQISATSHTTPAFSSDYSEYDVGETTDYIFLPTFGDMLNTSYGFSSDVWNDINRRAHASDYAKSQGLYVSTNISDKDEEYAIYSLRSSGDDSFYITGVRSDGSILNSWVVIDICDGIRPALCLDPLFTVGVVHFFVTVEGFSATCTEDGYAAYKKCVNCNYTEGYEVITATGHSLSDWIVITEATTEAEGLKAKVCSKCNAQVETEIIPKAKIIKIEVKISDSIKLKDEIYVVILPDQKVSDILSSFNEGVVIKDADGKEISGDTVIGSGFTVNLLDKDGNVLDTKTIIVPGDNDSDGKITAGDARKALRKSVNLEGFSSWQEVASKLAKGEKITAADARIILRISVKLEDIKNIFKNY